MREIDGVLRDWGEVASKGVVKAKKGRNIAGGAYVKPARKPNVSATAARQKLSATVKKAPEVMVKISGGGKDMRSIKAHFDYISRNGEVEIEDEQGRIHQGKEEVRDVRDDWKGSGIPYENGKRREAFNIVLSMPPGTDRAAVKDAARAFASELFGNHQYVFAAHDDENHPHVHLAVKAVDLDGVRLNPRKADLQHWRETFAEKLREQGIEANATPRQLRGMVKKADKQAVRHINKEHGKGRRKEPARVTASQRKAAELEAKTGRKHINPAQDNISARRKQVQHDFGTVARALAAGSAEDKQLALEIVQFVQQMPPVQTRHAEQVEALQRAAVHKKRAERVPEKDRAERKDQGRSR
ncbi:TPA: relaxase/mobilization nuclease domain-containing protein [Escherichia coli]|nr:relaxase/mobilization nuclease domain-containing protein [Escherichia coli]